MLRGAQAGPHAGGGARGNSGLALRALVRDAPRDVSRVVVVSVVDEASRHACSTRRCAAFWRRARVHPFARARRCGVHQQLSRHLAARRGSLGRRPSARIALAGGRAVVVANVGTALTIDAVDGERPSSRRRHRAGARDHGRKPAGRHPWHPPPRAAAASHRRVRCSPPTPRARSAAGSHVRRRGVHRSRGGRGGRGDGRPARAVPHRRRGAGPAAPI